MLFAIGKFKSFLLAYGRQTILIIIAIYIITTIFLYQSYSSLQTIRAAKWIRWVYTSVAFCKLKAKGYSTINERNYQNVTGVIDGVGVCGLAAGYGKESQKKPLYYRLYQ